jgi:hypothetical protein
VAWLACAQGTVGTEVRLLHRGDPSGDASGAKSGISYGTVHAGGAFASAGALADAAAFVRAQHVAAHADAAVRTHDVVRCACFAHL